MVIPALLRRSTASSPLILVSIGGLVGVGGPTKLATIVQLDPIYVTFNVSEQDVLRVKTAMAARGLTPAQVGKIPIEVGLMDESGYPHRGTIDYIAPNLDTSTGTLEVRGIFENPKRALLPGMFTRIRVPLAVSETDALLVPDMAIGADQAGNYLLLVDKDNVVQQRTVVTGQLVGPLRVITSGLTADDVVVVSGNQRAIPGQKIDPQATTLTASACCSTAPDGDPCCSGRGHRSCQQALTDDLQVLHRAAGAGQCAGHRHRADWLRGAVYAAGGAISQCGAADCVGDHELSWCQRQYRGEHGGFADRAAGERRAGHAVYAVHQCLGRHVLR